MTGHELLKTGLQVSFRVVAEEVLAALDQAEFGMRLLLKFVALEGEDDQDEDYVAEDTVEWGCIPIYIYARRVVLRIGETPESVIYRLP
jgi:hypothetical protein